jgi:hypothetical protein
MWTKLFPLHTPNTSSTDSSSSPPPPVAIPQEITPSACEAECVEEQKSLVACVESIRAARLKATRDDASSSASATDCSDHHDGDDDGGDHGSTSTDTPECLPMAVAAWTKCCEEANLRERGQKEEND